MDSTLVMTDAPVVVKPDSLALAGDDGPWSGFDREDAAGDSGGYCSEEEAPPVGFPVEYACEHREQHEERLDEQQPSHDAQNHAQVKQMYMFYYLH